MDYSAFLNRLDALDDQITMHKQNIQANEERLKACIEEYDRLIEWGQIAFGY